MLKLKQITLQLQTLGLSALSLALLLDILTKIWANVALGPHIRHKFIPGLLNLILVNNIGLAFSLANDNALLAKILACTVFVILVCFYIKRYFFSQLPNQTKRNWLEQIGMSIIVGAAAGNLLERIIYGHVTDFLEFTFISFPVFNVADVLIDVGTALFVLSYISDTASPIKQ